VREDSKAAGVLWGDLDAGRQFEERSPDSTVPAGKNGLAFAGLYLFMLLLYARPNDLFPSLGEFPLVRIIAVLTLLIYVVSKLTEGESITIWPLELKMIGLIILLGVAFAPLAQSPQDSIDTLAGDFLRVVAVFVLMINLITTLDRLRRILKLVTLCGGAIGLAAIRSYLVGDLAFEGLGERIQGVVGGMFGNPNELALSLVMLAPIAVALAVTSKGMARLFYLSLAGVLTATVIVTFSRGTFLGLMGMGGLLLWKVGRQKRLLTAVCAITITVGMVLIGPANYSERLSTIISTHEDPTGSAQRRQELLHRAVEMAVKRPLVGVGMGNFHIYSVHDQVAHNAYFEISAELGLGGLLAYMILIFAPQVFLRSIERETYLSQHPDAVQIHHLSVALQAGFIAYVVCSFFMSNQYKWYLYILVAYAVALRNIWDSSWLENLRYSVTDHGAVTTGAAEGSLQRGTLWKQCR
jgi:putative inorganic carbon (HCO3(-)) transporter